MLVQVYERDKRPLYSTTGFILFTHLTHPRSKAVCLH